MTTLDLRLNYTLAEGWLAPWVDALREGRVLARRCSACGQSSFVPQRACRCGSLTGEWVELPNAARIEHRCTGLDGDFALARFEGADTACVAALRGVPEGATRARLLPASGTLPGIVLAPVAEQAA